MAESVAIVLGAGYSAITGLPVTSRLFQEGAYFASHGARHRFEDVWRDYDLWCIHHPDASFEEYLGDSYLGNRGAFGPPFTWAVELIGAVLSSPRGQDAGPHNPRYAVRLTRPMRCAAHDDFWSCIMSHFEDVNVITTNYDICIERCLRHRRMARSSMPGFFYGGLPLPQKAKGVALPWRKENRMRAVNLEGTIPLFKIHGSLNWALHDGGITLYQDLRAAFRRGGEAAIVPPIPEKEIPPWLQPVWTAAEQALACAHSWVVCGYSLPPYDTAMRQMLFRAAQRSRKTLFLLDPVSRQLKVRWEMVTLGAEITCLAGLPTGTVELRRRWEAQTSEWSTR